MVFSEWSLVNRKRKKLGENVVDPTSPRLRRNPLRSTSFRIVVDPFDFAQDLRFAPVWVVVFGLMPTEKNR